MAMRNYSSYGDRSDVTERVVSLNRVAKVEKGGRRFSFSALIVVGDLNGRVGAGLGKAREVPEAIRKGVEIAKKNMISVPMVGTTIPHEVRHKWGAAKVMLARFNPNGSPDMGFGTGGTVLTAMGDGDDVAASAVALQADGRIVVAGHATDSRGTNLMVARYRANGSPDTSFGTGGSSVIPLGTDGTAEANALVLQGNRAVVTGYASDGGAIKTMLAGLTLAPRDTTRPVLEKSGIYIECTGQLNRTNGPVLRPF